MRRSHRFLLALPAVAVLAAGGPLWAADVDLPINVEDLPIVENNPLLSSSSDLNFLDTLIYDSEAPVDGPVPNLILGDAQSLVIKTATGVNFKQGVNINAPALNLEIQGSATFDLTPPVPADPPPVGPGTEDTVNKLNIKQLAFRASDDASAQYTLTITNGQLDLGDTPTVSIDDKFKITAKNPTIGVSAITPLSNLSLGENSLTDLSFDADTMLKTNTLKSGAHGAAISGPLYLGTSDSNFTKGLAVAESITVNGNLIINGPLSGGGATNFIFDSEASIFLGADSIGSTLLDNTKFKISDKVVNSDSALNKPFVVFKPFDRLESANLSAYEGLIRKLSLDAVGVRYASGSGDIAYDNDSGLVVFAQFGNNAPMHGIPDYGLPFVKALYETEATPVERIPYNQHRILAIALQGEAKSADVSEKLNSLMGNVPNAALSTALSGNMNQVMGHLNATLSPTMPGFAGPAGAASGLWVLPGYSMTDVSGSPQDGYGDLEIKNPNLTLGYDRWINDRLRMGVFAALSQPESQGSTETIQSDNLQAGLYGQAQLNYGLTVNAGVAYSRQSHEAERDIPDIFALGYKQMASASFNSDALSAALEISRLYPLGQNTFVRPTVAYNYVAASMDGYTEKSNIINQGNSLAQKTEAADFTMHLVRMGAEGGWSDGLTTVTGRLFWIGNLGDTQPKTQASLITDASLPFTLVGAEYDKNMVNVGLSAQYSPAQLNGLTFGLNYDALLGSNAKSHNVSLMMRYEF